MGTLKVKKSFSIQRGFVVAGDIVEGTCKIGTTAEHPSGATFRIEGVEMLDVSIRKGIAYPALVLSEEVVKKAGLDSPDAWEGKEVRTYEEEVQGDL